MLPKLDFKSKWEQTGLLEGLGEREQSQISVLLENQANNFLMKLHRLVHRAVVKSGQVLPFH